LRGERIAAGPQASPRGMGSMSYRFAPIASLALALVLGSCSLSSNESGPPPLLTALPRSLSAPETSLIEADNQFGFNLLRQAAQAQPETPSQKQQQGSASPVEQGVQGISATCLRFCATDRLGNRPCLTKL